MEIKMFIGVLVACIGLVALGYNIRVLHMGFRRQRIERMKKAKGMLFTKMFNQML